MAETITLDPSEVAVGRTALDITPWIGKDGIDWGDGAIQQHLAEANRGNVPVDYRVPNRTITIPLALKQVGATTFETARSNIQAKAARLQQEGGWLKRVTASGKVVFADITNATLKLGGGWGQAHRDYDIDGSLTLECIPDFYGAELDLGDNVTTTAAELIFTETGLPGDYPGRCRIVVDNDQANTQLGLIWGIRSRHYSAATTAALAYASTQLTPIAGAAPGGIGVRQSSVGNDWTPILSTDLAGTGPLTHTGTYRVWAQAEVADPSFQARAVDLRLVWDVGDLTHPVENSPVVIPPASGPTYLLDFGEVRLDAPPVGVHRWQGHFQARTPETILLIVGIGRVWFFPVDEGYGVLRAPIEGTGSFTSYSARDEFNQTAGALTGKTAPLGGVWAGAGDADDFTVETTGKTAQRTAISDTSVETGRYAISGVAAMTNQVVQADVTMTWTVNDTHQAMGGVLARYVDINNWLGLWFRPTGVVSQRYVLARRVAAVTAYVAYVAGPVAAPGDKHELKLLADASGRWAFWIDGVLMKSAFDSALVTGGALASGKPGIYDSNIVAVAATRNYDNFAAWVPTLDAVMHPSQSAELRTDGMFREDVTGAAYGPISHVVGDLPRLPPSGPEGRTCQIMLKDSRGDLDQLPDPNADDISARGFHRSSWLTVPG